MPQFEEIAARPLEPRLLQLTGISRASVEAHHRLYQGYVAKRNEILGALADVDLEKANQVYSDVRALKVDLTFAIGGIKNHELYFAHLGGEGGDPDGAFRALVERDFGSVAAWRSDLRATAIAARGWAWTAYDWDERRLFNYLGDAQNTFPVWNATPLVALDVYEHAYFLDYQTDRPSYVDAFFENLDWDGRQRLDRGVLDPGLSPPPPRRDAVIADALIVVGGYLIGSIPFGFVLPRLVRGEDIRERGSGNVGASNVWRVYGRSLGIPVALLDVAKGFVPALVGLEVGGDWVGVLAGAAAMIGHARPVFLAFGKGGKMVATAGGVALALAPLAAAACLVVWLAHVRGLALRVARVDRHRGRAARPRARVRRAPGRSSASPRSLRSVSSSCIGRTSAGCSRAPSRGSRATVPRAG